MLALIDAFFVLFLLYKFLLLSKLCRDTPDALTGIDLHGHQASLKREIPDTGISTSETGFPKDFVNFD
jgi:hypothetical protein